VNYTITTESLT